MKIERKIILLNAIYLVLIVIIGGSAIQSLNSVSSKQRFLEIADDLNTSFLEMRLSEKNYFLFNNITALYEIKTNISKANDVLDEVKDDIIPVIGESGYNQLEKGLYDYNVAVTEAIDNDSWNQQIADNIRAKGHDLEETSSRITKLEREHISNIINRSKLLLFSSFFAVIVTALIVSRVVSRMVLKPIKYIELQARSIAAGDYSKIESSIRRDEFGVVIEAINTMSEELEQREEELIQSKKLASMGVLVAGVAHELNNPVNNISMIAQTYEEMYDKLSPSQRREFMEKVDQESERIKQIVDNLLDFAKPREPRLSEVDINELLRKALLLVQNSLNVANIKSRVELAEGLPRLLLDENQMQQVLVNLFVNAAQAMRPEGRLTVRTSLDSENGMVEIRITDTGKGIPSEYIPHIFDPFFSTKEEGGTGLGLSVSYSIIKSHGGNIKVDSRMGLGTTFTIQLPVNDQEKGSA
ncbi:sensor protein ZraS [bacterium BMS3Abin01]|nr:sensor protein ZraS [bacterium BMS3Abin01]HDZ59426.1 sensor histidine kinase [Actinomycetota bacterium]